MHRSLAALVVTALVVAGCGAPTGPSEPPADGSADASPSAALASASPEAAAELIGTWTRTQDCESMLAAFEDAGLVESQADWIIGNWVGDPADVEVDPSDLCADARPPEEHSHFFTPAGEFGSFDATGEQVDFGDYTVIEPGTLSFPTHATEFGYDGDIVVEYVISGDSAEFEVQMPADCDASCQLAHAWALSAFFGDEPWTRTD